MSEYLPPAILTSLNTIKHGCRSQQQLLPHENPAEWIQMREMYMAEYNPQTQFLEELLDETVRAHWFLKRNQTRVHIIQVDLPEDPRLWRPEDHHQIALFTRYLTAAERTFHRALAKLDSHSKLAKKTEKAQEPAKEKAEKPPKPSKQEVSNEPIIIEQWVEVRRIDNKVVTQFFPPNEELEQTIATADPKPTEVYRRLFFPDGVPTPYEWTRPRKGQAKNGGLAIQRMTVETWLSLRDKERESGNAESTGHLTLRDWRDRDAS